MFTQDAIGDLIPMSKTIFVFSDGGSRGNPGPAAIGCLIEKDSKKISEISKYIGEATNNQAEYSAVIEALKYLHENKENLDFENVEVFLDSQLVVEQLNLRYKLKNEKLVPLFWEIRDLVMKLGAGVTFKYIPRIQNAKADKLVNKALDSQIK